MTIVLNTVYDTDDGKVYDVAFKFTNLVRLEANLEIGNDYAGGIDVEIDKIYKNLLRFTIESACILIECFNIELVSITEADPFQREMICLDDPDVTFLVYSTKKQADLHRGGLLIRILNNIKHWRKDTAFFRHLQIFEAFFSENHESSIFFL